MSELVWFAAGATAAFLAMCVLRLRRSPTKRSRRRHRTALRPLPRPSGPSRQAVEAQRVATSIADEIADLASAVEGSAYDLVAAAPERAHLPRAAQHFLASVQRLRALHGKLVAFANEAAPVVGTADLGEVVASLTEELQHLRLGLELEAELTPGLPAAAAGLETVRNALLFICSAMFRAEPGATHLTIAAERDLGPAQPQLRIELLLESLADSDSAAGPTKRDSGVALAIEAATRLVESHGGEVTMTRLPGRAVRTLLMLPASDVPEVAGPPVSPALQTANRRARHDFGGALVVEADPDVRAMLAKELRSSGRAVFACADGTSARTFLEATPDRFELLIVDQHHRLDDGDALGQTIRRLTPDLKICVLSPPDAPAGNPSGETWPDLCCIRKPFGVHELRQALASVLGA